MNLAIMVDVNVDVDVVVLNLKVSKKYRNWK